MLPSALFNRGREGRKKFSLDWKVSKVSSKEYIKNHLFFLNDIPYRRQCANIRIYKCVCSHFLPFLALFSTLAFMFCPHCIQSMRVPTQFECFICLESIRIEFMLLSWDLLAVKLNYLQRGGGCCKKVNKKWIKNNIM